MQEILPQSLAGKKARFWPYDKLLSEVENKDVAAFCNFVRMNSVMVKEILDRVGTTIKNAIPGIERQSVLFICIVGWALPCASYLHSAKLIVGVCSIQWGKPLQNLAYQWPF